MKRLSIKICAECSGFGKIKVYNPLWMREIAVKIVEEIWCPDYEMGRETARFKEFFAFLETTLTQIRERTIDECLEIVKHGFEMTDARDKAIKNILKLKGKHEASNP